MDLASLGAPAHLWRRWTLLAAEHAGREVEGARIRHDDRTAELTAGDGRWLRMRRMVGDRAVLWGCGLGDRRDPGGADSLLAVDLSDAAPDWATAAYDGPSAVGFLAWHAHGRWWSVPPRVPVGVGELLGPVATDEALLDRWRTLWPGAGHDVLREVAADPARPSWERLVPAAAARRAARQITLGDGWDQLRLSRTAADHLRAQVHAQMRAGDEIGDRGRPPRPPLLRQWGRVHGRAMPFRHTVGALGQPGSSALVHARDDNGLTDQQAATLDNVLLELRMAETDSESGAWLFARVTGDGRGVRLERAWDSWPSWYAGPGPGMSALLEEMTERTPRWRPAWAGLLPARRG